MRRSGGVHKLLLVKHCSNSLREASDIMLYHSLTQSQITVLLVMYWSCMQGTSDLKLYVLLMIWWAVVDVDRKSTFNGVFHGPVITVYSSQRLNLISLVSCICTQHSNV